MKNIFCLALLILSNYFYLNAQESLSSDKERILKSVSDYFLLERENIHMHLDKAVFFTNESVSFKGYVFHRKKNIPFFTTINIHAVLLNEEGKIINTQLLYGDIGSFSGNFKLDETYKSGKYYIQVYTNWMNNFKEDESSVYEIEIINIKDGKATISKKADYSKININLYPEGGLLLAGTNNIVAIEVSDCNNNPVSATKAKIINDKNEIVKELQINKMGYGKFDLTVNENEVLKCVVTLNGIAHEQIIPSASKTGITVDINNYSLSDRVIVKVKTNHESLHQFNTTPLYMIIQKDGEANIVEVNFNNETERTLILKNEDLTEGINTIRFIDSNSNEIAQRLIYKTPKTILNSTINKSKENNEEIEFSGKINYPNLNISICVIPENTISIDETNNIYSSFLISPYIKTTKKVNTKYYFDKISKQKQYELDLFLICQKSKYEWKNILSTPPQSNFTFDMGITLKGKLPSDYKKKGIYKVRLFSLFASIDDITSVNENNEFSFHNLVIPEGTPITLTLLEKGKKPTELNITPILVNHNKPYYKVYKPSIPNCATESVNLEIPAFSEEITIMDEITIEASKKLKYEKEFGNGNLRGYKVTENDQNRFRNVLQFIGQNGFNVQDRMHVSILSRTVNSINGAQSRPIVYINNIQALDFDMLRDVRMDEIDEIYLNPHAIVPSVRNNVGMIKIYFKSGIKSKVKNNSPNIIIENTYKKVVPFENTTYATTTGKGFENFGLIDWHPLIMTDEDGNFKFKIPKTSQKNIKIIIEGFSADGKLISETKTISLN